MNLKQLLRLPSRIAQHLEALLRSRGTAVRVLTLSVACLGAYGVLLLAFLATSPRKGALEMIFSPAATDGFYSIMLNRIDYDKERIFFDLDINLPR
jgi:hypothetical protein